jgi:hypothetical protein
VFQALTPACGRRAASRPGQHLKIQVTGITLMRMPARRRDRASVPHFASRASNAQITGICAARSAMSSGKDLRQNGG